MFLPYKIWLDVQNWQDVLLDRFHDAQEANVHEECITNAASLWERRRWIKIHNTRAIVKSSDWSQAKCGAGATLYYENMCETVHTQQWHFTFSTSRFAIVTPSGNAALSQRCTGVTYRLQTMTYFTLAAKARTVETYVNVLFSCSEFSRPMFIINRFCLVTWSKTVVHW